MSETKKSRKVPPGAFRRQLLATLPVILNTFVTGNTTGWTPNAIYLFQKGDPEPFTASQCSMIASISEISCAIFSLPIGYIADRIGRKTMMTIAGVIHLLAGLLLTFFSSYTSIIIARFLLGIGSLFVHSVSSITIGELSSPEIRAKISSINLLLFYLGQLFPSLLNILFSSYHIISYNVTIISALWFPFLYFLVETPYFLVSKSKYKEAKENLKMLRTGYTESQINEEFDNFKNYIDEEKKRKQELNWWKYFGSRRILKPLLMVILIHHFFLGTGSYVIVAYITKIIPNNIQLLPKRYYPFIVQFIQISTSLSTPFFIELLPRRVAFLSSILCAFLNLVLISATYFCFEELSIKFCQWILVISVLLFLGVKTSFIQGLVTTARAELLPQTIKGIGSSICLMAVSSTNVLYFHVYHFLTESYNLYWIFFIFAINSFILFFIVYFLLPETRGKFLAEIQVEQNEEGCDKKEASEN